MADDAVIDQMEFGVGAGPVRHAGVKHFVADREILRLRADGADDAGGIEAQHARLAQRLAAQTDFRVDRIDGNGFDFHQQVVMARYRNRELEIEERFEVGDRLGMGKGDGFHERIFLVADGEKFGGSLRDR